MAEDVARAVGATSGEPIKIAGKDCTPRALQLRELAEIERVCVKQYIRRVLEVYNDNLDLLSDDDRRTLIREKMDEMASWDVTSLPAKSVYDPADIEITDDLENWLLDTYKDLKKNEDSNEVKKQKYHQTLQRVAATSLENDNLSVAEYEKLTRSKIRKFNVGYANWWITASTEGMIEIIYMAFKHNGVTKEQIFDEMSEKPTLLMTIAREIEALTTPKLGNT